VSLGDLLAILCLQLAALLAPLALGMTGLISGGTAGLASITAWFLVGIPLSYAVVDMRTSQRASPASDAPIVGRAHPVWKSEAVGPSAGRAATTLRVDQVLRS
jgi:hypothetical protein